MARQLVTSGFSGGFQLRLGDIALPAGVELAQDLIPRGREIPVFNAGIDLHDTLEAMNCALA